MPLKAAYKDYYTAAQVKKVLNITDGMLYNFIRNGDIEAIKLPGRKQSVYKREQVEKLARELKQFMPSRAAKTTTFVRATREDLPVILAISEALFGQGRSVTPLERRITWLETNPYTYHVLKQGEEIVGYVTLLPLRKGTDKIERLLGDTVAVDITPDDFADLQPGTHTDVYVMSIGVKPTTNLTDKKEYGSSLIRGLRRLLIEIGEKGVIIDTIAARSNTPDGIRLMRHLGFTELEPVLPGTRSFIIRVPESGIPLIMEYKHALRESQTSDHKAQPDSKTDSKAERKPRTMRDTSGQNGTERKTPARSRSHTS